MGKGLRIILIVIFLFILISIGGAFYLVDYAITPDHRGKDLKHSVEYMVENYPFLEQWMDSLNTSESLKDTFIVNKEGVKLHAFYVPAALPTANTALLVHGYTDNAIRMLHIGYLYSHDLGFNILLPDLQFHGLSGGNAIQMGWKDRYDLLEWMNVAHAIYGDTTRMVLHGISMGAAAVMMTSGEPQEAFVKCIVEDCGYTTVWEQFSHVLASDFKLPDIPLLYLADKIVAHRYGWTFREASALKQIEKCRLPMLFIHGDADTYVPAGMVYRLYEAKPGVKELWVVSGATHATSYKENKEEYTAKVKAFVERYLINNSE